MANRRGVADGLQMTLELTDSEVAALKGLLLMWAGMAPLAVTHGTMTAELYEQIRPLYETLAKKLDAELGANSRISTAPCPKCRWGRTDGGYCDCQLGRDLMKVETMGGKFL